MKLLETQSTDCYYNLAFEEHCFERLDPSESYVCLWQNLDTIVVGRYQNTAEEVNEPYVREHGVRVVRRLSGGGAVYHDLGNLNYTIIADANGTGADFARFTRPVVDALAKLGVHAEISGRNDITIDCKKFSGNAQYSKRGRTMHHGTLLFSSNLDAVADALRPPGAKLESKGIKSVRSRVTNICEHTTAAMRDFSDALLESLFPHGVERSDAPDLQAVERLRAEKYALREWNYGMSPPYSVRVSKRFDCGSVELMLDVKGDRIRSASIRGDFFGTPDIDVLERALIGAIPTGEGVAEAISGLEVSEFIYGLTNAQFASIPALS
ncbi:MAG: lipoate--protein ligase [Oscillospiraceae bacterium]|jgi:lipoate-protein ligase A|nr:lipoate--protein ligase [Oscillospiraceae bacterium]